MRLVFTKGKRKGQSPRPDELLVDFRGEGARYVGTSSSGRVYVRERGGTEREFYPAVYGLEWVEDAEAPEDEVAHPKVAKRAKVYGTALAGTGGLVSVTTKDRQPGARSGAVLVNVQAVAHGVFQTVPLTPQQAAKLALALHAAADAALADGQD